MEIKICTTNMLSTSEWLSYLLNFNALFATNHNISYFKHKYNTVVDGHSYHALLLNDNHDIVGGCTVMPYNYKKKSEEVKLGQAVDVFICEEYRTDPLMLKRMYSELKKILIINGIISVIAVPNDTAYPYWKNIVKWKDIGDLSYWVLPLRLGNIIKKNKFLNIISLILIRVFVFINKVLSLIFNKRERKSVYEIKFDKIFINNRFSKDHIKVLQKDIAFYFRLVKEDGIQTAYLIYAKQNNRVSFKSLIKSVSYIIKNTDADLILYVGPLKLFQTLFIKVPRKFEPKKLPLTCDILEEYNRVKYADMLEFKNWNFGLLNYDVR